MSEPRTGEARSWKCEACGQPWPCEFSFSHPDTHNPPLPAGAAAEQQRLRLRTALTVIAESEADNAETRLAREVLASLPEVPAGGLVAELEAERERADKAERSRAHTQQWYAERIEAIKDEARRVGNWDRVASILVNGTPSVLDPPTYAQQLNMAKHAAEAAEARAEKAEAERHEWQKVAMDTLARERALLASSPERSAVPPATVTDDARARIARRVACLIAKDMPGTPANVAYGFALKWTGAALAELPAKEENE